MFVLIKLFLSLHLFGLLACLIHLLFDLGLVDGGDSVYEEASDDNIPELKLISSTYSLYQGFFFSFSFESLVTFALPEPAAAEEADPE